MHVHALLLLQRVSISVPYVMFAVKSHYYTTQQFLGIPLLSRPETSSLVVAVVGIRLFANPRLNVAGRNGARAVK